MRLLNVKYEKARLIAGIFCISLLIAMFIGCGNAQGASLDYADERLKTLTLSDGVTIAAHYYNDELEAFHRNPDKYVESVVKYAAEAYNQIVYVHGFDTPGFSFANPDKDYCYDKDKVIDIYITGDSDDMPYYDIIERKGTAYDAIIMFSAQYKGDTVSIRGALFHEMLHLIIYSYNKNIEPWYRYSQEASCHLGGDWYVEGLARYFETVAGSYENFFSEGFVKKQSDRIMIYQGGANYLMNHPSQSLEQARYDYALFWAYIHKKFGMEKIEELSRKMRFISEDGLRKEISSVFSKVLNEDFEETLRGFAMAMYLRSFDPAIKEGLNDIKPMSLSDVSRKHEKRINSWASDFIKLDLSKKGMPSVLSLKKSKGRRHLKMTVMVGYDGNKMARFKDVTLRESDELCRMDLKEMKSNGVEELILIITNASSDYNATYEVLYR